IQIDESFKRYGRYTGLSTVVIFGGVNQKSQVNKLNRGVDIVVATPGRLLDLMNQGHLSLSNVEILVLDEADRMLDMGFINDIKKILKAVPKKRQTLFFSATMPPAIVKLSQSMLNNPAKVEIEPESPTVEAIQQGVYFVEKSNKKSLLVSLLKDPEIPSALVFTRTKHGANKVVKMLNKENIGAEAIHGNKSQAARQRALGNFKDQKTRVLVATDIAARGIDVDELKYVINFDLPNEAETYVHRIGRTGRAGADGTALSFCDSSEQDYLRDIEKLIAKRVPVVEHSKLTMEAPTPTAPSGRTGGGGGHPGRSKPKRQQRSRRPKAGNRQRNRR
ncbi:MAG: DEAD/DEAH box helicase, partial [Balneolaceae bacterium]